MIRQAARDRPAEAQVICCARACTATLRSCLCCCGSYDHPSPNHAVLATSVWSFFLPMKSQEGHSHHDGRGMTQVTACMLLAVHYWCCTIFIFIFNITFTFQPYSWEVFTFLPSTIVWTSRGHRCPPFSPSVRAFIFCRA